MNQVNTLGQTPLHLSVNWSAGLQHLLEAGANVDAVDHYGYTPIFYAANLCLHESVNVLAETHCALHRFPNQYEARSKQPLLYKVFDMITEGTYTWFRHVASEEEARALSEGAEAVLDTSIKHVVERRRMLEALIRTSLDAKAAEQLRISAETVLDRNASRAISMLREKIDIPVSLTNLTIEHATVYHFNYLSLQQAQLLWDAGFREIDEFDEWGLTPLMRSKRFHSEYMSNDIWEFAAWLVGKGADLYRQQEYAFRKRMANNEYHPSGIPEIYVSDKASGRTASHYLAGHWHMPPADGSRDKEWIELFLSGDKVMSEQARRVQRRVLADAQPDCCDCACSTIGCRPYTMMAKKPILRPWDYPYRSLKQVPKELLRMSQAFAQLVNVDQPGLAWLRYEMIRFNTFERLKLQHTCCEMAAIDNATEIILERYEDDEIHAIQEEQAEQLEKLETLLVEFEEKYEESGSTLSEFLEGYWTDRMIELTSEEGFIDHEALIDMGIRLRKISSTSSQSSDDGVEEVVSHQGHLRIYSLLRSEQYV